MPPITPFLRTKLLPHSRTLLSTSRPSILTNLARTASRRSFHASPRAQSLDVLLNGTQAALETLHVVTGTPWVVTLPLAAVLVRATILLPVTLYQRRLMRTQASLSPVMQGWISVFRKEVVQANPDMRSMAAQEKATQQLATMVKVKQVEIYKRWGCQGWKVTTAPFAQLPIWLVMVETIRRMCGTNEGLLRLTAKSGQYLAGVVGIGPSDELASEQAIAAVEPTTVVETVTQSSHIVPDLATGGALWFPDLLVADPHLVLPFVLSATILLNLFGRTSARASNTVLTSKTWKGRLSRSLGVVALAVGPLTLQVPAGMLIYWISSSLFAYLQALILDRLMPVKHVSPKQPKQPLLLPNGFPNPGPSDVGTTKA